jgi:hypothetical protein
MAIRINTDNNEIEISDVATEETLRDLLKAVEVMNGNTTKTKKADPEVKKTQEEIKKLAKSNKELNITMKDWSGNFDDTMKDLDRTMTDRGKAVAGALGKIVKNTGNIISDLIRGPVSFDALGRAIQAGAGAIGDGLGQAVDSISVLGTKVPGIGAAMSMAGAAFGAAAMAAAAYAQNMADGFVALSQSGANYNGDIVKTASQIQNLGLTMNSFTQIVQSNAQGLANYGGTVAAGAKRFTELAEVMRNQYGGELYALGLRYEEQAEQLAKFTQTQSRNTAFQNMGYLQQSQLYKEYITDLNVLVGLTGKSRQQLSEEMAQNELRADAAVRLKGATLDAQKAISFVFNTTGSDSAISQVLMAGIAGKSLALEMAAGNSTIKSFVAGNSEAAQKIRDLGEAVARGEITQDEFKNGLRDIMPSIAASGEEFEGLYGISDVATVMTQAASDVQKLQVQFQNLGKAVGPGTKGAEGAGGAILSLESQLNETVKAMKSGVNQGISELALEFGIGKDIGGDIQGMIDSINGLQSAFSDFLTNFIIVAKAPWDFLMGGTSDDELKDQLLTKLARNPELASALAGQGLTEQLINSENFSGDDARSMLMGLQEDQYKGKGPVRSTEEFKKIKSRMSGSADSATSELGLNISQSDNGFVIDHQAAGSSSAQLADATQKAYNYDYSDMANVQKFIEDIKAGRLGTIGFGHDRSIAVQQEIKKLVDLGQGDKAKAIIDYIQSEGGLPTGEYDTWLSSIDHDWENPKYAKDLNRWSIKNYWNQMAIHSGIPTFKQYGGAVGMSNPYIVGERGPELFTPSTAGRITPTDDLATKSGSVSVTAGIDRTNNLLSELLATATNELESNKEIGNVTVSKLNAILGTNRKNNKHIQEIAQQG